MREILIRRIKELLLQEPFFDPEYVRVCDQLSSDLEDLFLPTLIDQFYKKGQNSFISFLQGLTPDQLADSSPSLWMIFQSLLSDITTGMRFVQSDRYDHERFGLIGDLHPYKAMRYFTDDGVVFKKGPYYHTLITKLLNYFPGLQNSFPSHIENADLLVRRFVPVLNETSSQEKVAQYYTNLGQLTGIILFLQGIDINAENIITHLPFPVLFDLECIFTTPNSDNSPYSIDSTGILMNSSTYDVSAFTGGTRSIKSYLKPVLTGTEAEPKIEWNVPSKGIYYNIPLLDGKKVNPISYIENFLNGLSIAQSTIAHHKDALKKTVMETEVGTRVVISPTRQYRIILQSYAFPPVYTLLQARDHFKGELQKRTPICRIFQNQSLLDSEISALSKWQIPKFSSEIHSPEIYDSEHNIVARFPTSQCNQWEKHCTHIDDLIEGAKKKLLQTYSN